MTRRLTAVLVGVILVLSACSSDSKAKSDPLAAAQTRVDSAQTAVTDAHKGLDTANAAFCTETKGYIESIDRYGQLFEQQPTTLGDLKTAGADLTKPRDSVEAAVKGVEEARAGVATAEKELVDAQNALGTVVASAASQTPPPSSTTSTTTTLIPPATID